jgi:hypothetical protein
LWYKILWKETPSVNEKMEFWIVFGAAAVGGAVLGYFVSSVLAVMAGAALAGAGARQYINYSAQ